MTLLSSSSKPFLSRPERPIPPAPWIASLLGLSLSDPKPAPLDSTGLSAEVAEAAHESAILVSLRIPEARRLDLDTFIESVAGVYDYLRDRFSGFTPARFWNHIPCIHEPAGDGIDRYMAFNLGRRAGLRRWLGPGSGFTSRIATATGIGHRGDDLVVHGLGWRGEVNHVENPRQRPAYRYSPRFGPAAPSFARATWLRNTPAGDVLAVGGTASIRGEETIAPGNLSAQLEETLVNLDALVTAAGAAVDGSGLAGLVQARIFHVRPQDEAIVRERAMAAFPNATRLDVHRADVCRHELLLEIEGIALSQPEA